MKLRALPLSIILLCTFSFSIPLSALDRQPGADYRARRVALSKKLISENPEGVAVLFAATELEGPNALYGFRQDNNFFYLAG